MGSTGEPDRKRRHLSSISPTATASAKKQPFVHLSEDKKLDTAVLQYQNQKLVQKLEVQKVECSALETKLSQLKEKQKPYDETLEVVNRAWVELVDGLGSCSICTNSGLGRSGEAAKTKSVTEGGVWSPPDNTFLSRLVETGATQSSSCGSSSPIKSEVTETAVEKSKNILCKVVTAINDTWRLKDGLQAMALEVLPEDGSERRKMSMDLQEEVKNLRVALGDLHLTHKTLARELQCHHDKDAKNKAELKLLKAELESTISELEQSNHELATLKSERDAAVKGAYFPVLNLSNKSAAVDRTKDKLKDLRDLESSLHELRDQASNRLLEFKRLHERRIGTLKQLSDLQNTLKNMKVVTSSAAYALVKEQLAKSKAELIQYQTLYEKLQVEKDNLSWQEREINLKNDLLDVLHFDLSVAESRITELGVEIQKQISERSSFEARLEAAAKEPGRKKVIEEFRALVSSFPEEMGRMQIQLSTYKEAASDVHSLRADVRSLSSILDRKAKELEALSARSADQVAEMQKLQAVVRDLKDSELELKLILEMYRRESTDSRDVQEARESEYKTWAHVQSLNSSLDERNLELRVKAAIEAEAISQQRLAAAEAEIGDLRQKSAASRREKAMLSDTLKSKHEENEAYLAEIESIGQAYDDMQTQNQHLLQQITERDDYNIKLFLEGVRARQLKDSLFLEKGTIEKAVLQAKGSVDFCDARASRIGDQLKMCADKSQRLADDRIQTGVTLQNIQKRKLDVKKSSQHLRESLERSQSRVDKSRVGLVELQITLEKERFEKKRLEEEVEVVRRKASRLRSHIEGSSVTEKLQQELREYKEILKCSVCLDRSKEVVITKCFHLFCNPCVQRILERRHRKCPVCATSFGPNDVKPVYI